MSNHLHVHLSLLIDGLIFFLELCILIDSMSTYFSFCGFFVYLYLHLISLHRPDLTTAADPQCDTWLIRFHHKKHGKVNDMVQRQSNRFMPTEVHIWHRPACEVSFLVTLKHHPGRGLSLTWQFAACLSGCRGCSETGRHWFAPSCSRRFLKNLH